MGGHFLPVDLQPLFPVRVSLVARQEGHPLQAVILQQVLHQGTDCQVFIRIDAVVIILLVADGNHRALGPPPQLLVQLIPETLDLIGVRGHQDAVQLLDGREGEHAPLLAVILILAGEEPHRGEYDHVIVKLVCRFLQGMIHSMVKNRVGFAQKDPDGLSLAGNHLSTSFQERRLLLPGPFMSVT